MNMIEVLRRLFPDVEALSPSGFLANCPLHHDGDRRFVFFDQDGVFLGCSSGLCTLADLLEATDEVPIGA